MKKREGFSWEFTATDKNGENKLIVGMILSFFIPAFCIFGIMAGLFSDLMNTFQQSFYLAPLVEAVIIFVPSLWLCSAHTKKLREQVSQLFRFTIADERLAVLGEKTEGNIIIPRDAIKAVELERRTQGSNAMCRLIIKTKQKEKYSFHVRMPIVEVKRGNKDYEQLISGFHHLLDWTKLG